MKDYSVLEKIKNSAQDCEIPEGLKPENLDLTNQVMMPRKNPKRRIYQLGGIAAAMLVLVLAVTIKNQNGEMPTPVSEAAAPMAEEAVVETDGNSIDSFYAQAKDYEEIYDYIKNNDYAFAVYEMEESGAMPAEPMEEAVVEEAPAEDMMVATEESAAVAGGGYSQTNTQVSGVDEGDVVKTDGQYLYILRENKEIQIVKVKAGTMKEVSVISPESVASDISIQDMYLTEDTLQIVCQRYENDLKEEEDDVYYMDYRVVTCVYTYDISDRNQPKQIGKTEQDGSYYTSRKVGDYLYLFTSYYPDKGNMSENERNGVMPIVGETMIEPSDVYLPQENFQGSFGYMIISSVDENHPNKIKDKKAILDNANRFYVSTESIYLQRENWEHDTPQTAIAKFSYKDGMIKGESAAVINGVVTDDFANNEYNGYLRVLTTQWTNGVNSNNVYVLDKNMKIVGKIEDLAEEESIYAARFFGNIGYFVTYRQVDPLFSVDFSDPKNPKVIGELKITGFSEYLHFYGEDRLLGVGWETDPDTGMRIGLKLSMFDVSDPSNVQEIDKMVVKNIDYFPGEYDYKAFTISEEKNIIGFLTTSYERDGQVNDYMVYSYGEDGFKLDMSYSIQDNGYGWSSLTRGVYIDETFYVASQDKIVAFDMADGYEKIGELK